MLQLAYQHQENLKKLFAEKMIEEKFKYYVAGWYVNYSIELDNNSWNNLEYVSIDKASKILGFLQAGIDRTSNRVSDLKIINFYDTDMIFSRDFMRFLRMLFEELNFNKINFSVVVGNPAEKMYDKYIEKFGGRIVGIKKEHTRLLDGKLYDMKLYEILNRQEENKDEIYGKQT